MNALTLFFGLVIALAELRTTAICGRVSATAVEVLGEMAASSQKTRASEKFVLGTRIVDDDAETGRRRRSSSSSKSSRHRRSKSVSRSRKSRKGTSEVSADVVSAAARRTKADFKLIICPFLSALINEGVLPVKDSYSRVELEEITKQAGLDPQNATDHVNSNFKFNPDVQGQPATQDIFDMEGAGNEHSTSSGIHDCYTDFSHCTDPNATGEKCKGAITPEPDCGVPSLATFEKFWYHTDRGQNNSRRNPDNIIHRSELETWGQSFDPIDKNNHRAGSDDIVGSFGFIMDIFPSGGSKEQGTDFMTKEDLRTVFIDRRFPPGYTFPSR